MSPPIHLLKPCTPMWCMLGGGPFGRCIGLDAAVWGQMCWGLFSSAYSLLSCMSCAPSHPALRQRAVQAGVSQRICASSPQPHGGLPKGTAPYPGSWTASAPASGWVQTSVFYSMDDIDTAPKASESSAGASPGGVQGVGITGHRGKTQSQESSRGEDTGPYSRFCLPPDPSVSHSNNLKEN